MKVASKLVMLFRDPEGFGAALYDALQPSPDRSLERLEETLELSLVQFGIKDQKACGDIANFVDNNGVIQVTLLLVQHYEPPVLACVINELLRSVKGESLSSNIILTLPCILPAAKLKCDDKSSLVNDKKSLLYGFHMGPITDFSQDMVETAVKPPLTLQIHYEPLACLLQFVQCFKFPTAVIIGKRGVTEEHEILHQIGEHLASAFALCFAKSKIKLNIGKATKTQEPWRALYG